MASDELERLLLDVTQGTSPSSDEDEDKEDQEEVISFPDIEVPTAASDATRVASPEERLPEQPVRVSEPAPADAARATIDPQQDTDPLEDILFESTPRRRRGFFEKVGELGVVDAVGTTIADHAADAIEKIPGFGQTDFAKRAVKNLRQGTDEAIARRVLGSRAVSQEPVTLDEVRSVLPEDMLAENPGIAAMVADRANFGHLDLVEGVPGLERFVDPETGEPQTIEGSRDRRFHIHRAALEMIEERNAVREAEAMAARDRFLETHTNFLDDYLSPATAADPGAAAAGRVATAAFLRTGTPLTAKEAEFQTSQIPEVILGATQAASDLVTSVAGYGGSILMSLVPGGETPKEALSDVPESLRPQQHGLQDLNEDALAMYQELSSLTPGERQALYTSTSLPLGSTVMDLATDPSAYAGGLAEMDDVMRQAKHQRENMRQAIEALARSDGRGLVENLFAGDVGGAFEDLTTTRLPVFDDDIIGFASFMMWIKWLKAIGRRGPRPGTSIELSPRHLVAARRAGLAQRDLRRIQLMGARSPVEVRALKDAGIPENIIRGLVAKGGHATPFSYVEGLIEEAASIGAASSIIALDEGGGPLEVAASLGSAPTIVGAFRLLGLPVAAGRRVPAAIRGARKGINNIGADAVAAWRRTLPELSPEARAQWNNLFGRYFERVTNVERWKDGELLGTGTAKLPGRLEVETKWNPLTGQVERSPAHRLQAVGPDVDGVYLRPAPSDRRTRVGLSFHRIQKITYLDPVTQELKEREVLVDQRPDLADKAAATRDIADRLNIPIVEVIEGNGLYEGKAEPSYTMVIPRNLTPREREALVKEIRGPEGPNQASVLINEAHPEGPGVRATLVFERPLSERESGEAMAILGKHGIEGGTFTEHGLEVVHPNGLRRFTPGALFDRWARARAELHDRFGLEGEARERARVEFADRELEPADITRVDRAAIGTPAPGELVGADIRSVELEVPSGEFSRQQATHVEVVPSQAELGKWELTVFNRDKAVDRIQFDSMTQAIQAAKNEGAETIRTGRFGSLKEVGPSDRSVRLLTEEQLTAARNEAVRVIAEMGDRANEITQGDRIGRQERRAAVDALSSRRRATSDLLLLDQEIRRRKQVAEGKDPEFEPPAEERLGDRPAEERPAEQPEPRDVIDADEAVVGMRAAIRVNGKVYMAEPGQAHIHARQKAFRDGAWPEEMGEVGPSEFNQTIRLEEGFFVPGQGFIKRVQAREQFGIRNIEDLERLRLEATKRRGRSGTEVAKPEQLSVPEQGRVYIERADSEPHIPLRRVEAGEELAAGERLVWIGPQGERLARKGLGDHGSEAMDMRGLTPEEIARETEARGAETNLRALVQVRPVMEKGGLVRVSGFQSKGVGRSTTYDFWTNPSEATKNVIVEHAQGANSVRLERHFREGDKELSEGIYLGTAGTPPFHQISPANVRRALSDLNKPIEERVHIPYLAQENARLLKTMHDAGVLETAKYESLRETAMDAYRTRGGDPKYLSTPGAVSGYALAMLLAAQAESGAFGEEYEEWGKIIRIAGYSAGMLGIGRASWQFVKGGGTPAAARKAYDSLFGFVEGDALYSAIGPHLELSSVTRKSVDRLAKQLKDVNRLMEITQKGQAKRKWYRNANKEVRRVFGEDANLFAAILSATSPRRGVDRNVVDALMAYEVIRGGRFGTADAKVEALSQILPFVHETNARRLVEGRFNEIGESAGGKGVTGKIQSFYQNLIGNQNEIVVDVWMARIFGLMKWNPKLNKGQGGWDQDTSIKATALVQEAVAETAKRMGWAHDEVQAAMWTTVKWAAEKHGYEPPFLNKKGATPESIRKNIEALGEFIERISGEAYGPEFAVTLRDLNIGSPKDAIRFGFDEATASTLRAARASLSGEGGVKKSLPRFIDKMQFAFASGLMQGKERSRAMRHLLEEYKAQVDMFAPGTKEAKVLGRKVEEVESVINETAQRAERMWQRQIPFNRLLPGIGLGVLPLLQGEEEEFQEAGVSLPVAVVAALGLYGGARFAARSLRNLKQAKGHEFLARRFELMADLQDAFDITITGAKTGGRGEAAKRAAARDLGDAPTRLAESLTELLYEGDMSRAPLGEKLPFLIESIIKDPESLAKAQPATRRAATKLMEDLGTEAPHLREALEKAQLDFRLIKGDPILEKMRERFDVRHENNLSIRNLWARVLYNFTNYYEPLAQMQGDITGTKSPSLELNAELWARLTKGAPGQAEAMLKRGVIDYRSGKIREDVKPLTQILEEVGYPRLEAFEYYLTGRRALELYRIREERGLAMRQKKGEDLAGDPILEEIKMLGLSRKEAQSVVNKLDNAAFREHAADLYQYQGALLDYLADGGVIARRLADNLKEEQPNYVPMFRSLTEKEGMSGPRVRGSFDHVFAPLKRIKGTSEKKLLSPWTGIAMNVNAFAETVARNEVSKALENLKEMDPEGVWIREVSPPKRPFKLKGGEIAKQMAELGIPEQYRSLFENETFTIWRPDKVFGKKNTISVLQPDGSRKYYEVEPFVADALARMGPESRGMFRKIMAGITSVFRAGATTFSPAFLARNPFRDTQHGAIVSEYGFVPVVDTFRGVFHLFGKDDLYWQWLASGGSRATLLEIDRKTLRNDVLAAITNDPRFKPEGLSVTVPRGRDTRPLNISLNPLHWMRVASDFMENATRMGAFARAITGRGPRIKERGTVPEGVSREQIVLSGEEAREISLDFQRVGATGAVWRDMVAFWNPAVLGYDKFFRAHKNNPGRTMARAIAMITIPSVVNWLVNHDDPDWRKRPDWERDLFWLWKIPDTDRFVRLPKPFEFGVVYGSFVERTLDWMTDQDPKGMRRVADTMLNNFVGTLTPFMFDIAGDVPDDRKIGPLGFSGMMPTAARPFLEATMNFDFFRQHEIVAGQVAKRSPKYQYNAQYTSRWARDMGKFLDISPAKLEHFLFGHTAALGRSVISPSADALYNWLEPPESGEKPSDFPYDIPLIRGFVTTPPGTSAPVVKDFYDILMRGREVEADLKLLQETGEVEEFKRRALEGERLIAVKPTFERANRRINDLRSQIRQIALHPDLSGAEKTERIKPLMNQIIMIAEATVRGTRRVFEEERDPGTGTRTPSRQPPAENEPDEEDLVGDDALENILIDVTGGG